jgi:CBS domain-containing protein/gamma-glutamyl:cysteine ligase YbdK (ATP-grasp superfamily)
MGERKVNELDNEGGKLRAFTQRLLLDLRAMEKMIEDSSFEKGIRRIGAEQEVFLVDKNWRPASVAMEVLKSANDPHFTTEVALFNLEMNLDPVVWGGDCFSQMEKQLLGLLQQARVAAAEHDARIVLTGILPTIRKSDLGLENMTPIPRYFALNRAMTEMRGGEYEIHIRGVDELLLKHDSVMAESCNASFQAHFQVAPEEFARFYNIAQVATGPVLAAGTNSPLAFGRRLWKETRIALFQQSVDTRGSRAHMRESAPRVDFGRQWVRDSILEIFKEDIARYRILIASDAEDNPLEKLAKGQIPELKALRLHNGTIYRWNRACYGVMNGVPHLRIEMRALPSGPTARDEMASVVFWYGLVSALVEQYEDITKHIAFDDAKMNFLGAARLGLGAELTWLDGKTHPAQTLIREQLLPMAREGLKAGKVRPDDADLYLGVIEERVRTQQTGSRWMLHSLTAMGQAGTESERLSALTAGMAERQLGGEPVARWSRATVEEGGGWRHNYLRVEQFMTTDFVSVQEGDAVDLVVNVMLWENIRHVPVEDREHNLLGLVSYRSLLRLLADRQNAASSGPIPVSEIMRRRPIGVTPETTTLEAVEVMRTHNLGALPVVKDGRLVGMLTARNLMPIAARLLEEKLSAEDEAEQDGAAQDA